MAAQSKATGDNPVTPSKQQTEEYILVCAASFFMLAFNMGALMNIRSLILDEALKVAGSKQSTAALLGLTGTLGSLAEFVICPALGRYSDSVGRKGLITGSLTVTMLSELMMFSRSTSLTSLIAAGVVSTASMTSFITILRAGLSDRLSGTDLGVAHARLGIAAGLSVILGPLAASTLAAKLGNRYVYLMCAGMTALNITTLSLKLDETLAPENRKKMNWAEASPLSFVKLLGFGNKLRLCSVALALQTIAEPRYILPYATLIWRERYNYDTQTLGQLSSVFGLAYTVGAFVAKKRMKQIGAKRHVTESNLANIVAWLIWSRFTSFSGSCAAYATFIPGIRKRDGLEVMITDYGAAHGWGKGEISAMMNNFKSLSAVLAPSIFAKAYTTMTTNGRDFPGAPMMAGGLVTVASQVLYMAMLASPDEPPSAKSM